LYPLDIFGIIDFLDKERICRCSATALDAQVIFQYISFESFEKQILKNNELRVEVIKALIKLNE
jgi:hypothetical protein